MAGFSDCIMSAREQGVLSAEEAERLIARYEEHLRARRAAGAADPHAAARDELAAEFDAAAARARRLADLATTRRDAIAAHLESYRGPDGKPDVYEGAMRVLENFGFSGTSSVRGRAQAILAIEHAKLADGLREFERNFYTGMRHDTVKAQDLVREMLGERTGRPEIAAFAKSLSAAYERLRERFNAAGGEIGKIEGGYIPQFHDGSAVYKVGFSAWRDFIRPLLARERMHDPLTNGPLSEAGLDDALKVAYERIVTDGWIEREPSMQPSGKGALANQRQDHRFFAFKDADAWLQYDAQFGRGDPLKSIFGHINGMARDIGALEVLGPNPGAMVEWMRQVVQKEHALARTGADSLFAGKADAADAGSAAASRIGDLWYWVRGRETIRQGVSNAFADIRNVLTSAQLGSAVITAAATDPAIERMALRQIGISDKVLFGHNAKVYLDTVSQYFEQLPIAKGISWMINQMTGAPREQAARAGMIAQEFVHILGDEARYAGSMGGHLWSRWLADRTVTLSGLEPLTNARRSVFQLELQGFLADHVASPMAELPERLQAKLQGYGIDAPSWERMRQVPLHPLGSGSAGLLRAADIAAVDRGLGEKLAEMLIGETERAVPTSTMRSKAFVMGSQPRGTVPGELRDSFLQYKSFGLSIMTLQMEAIARETALHGRPAGANYAAQMFILTTLGGAVSLQLKAIANGRDPNTLNAVTNLRFWGASMAAGGGMGLLGDFLFADSSRYGYSLADTLAGPTFSVVNDVAKFTLGNLWKLAQGKDIKMGKDAVEIAGHYTPLISSLWATRLLYRREVLDQLQYQVDPHAHKSWRAQERKAMTDHKQGTWWPAGEPLPSRAPEFGSATR